MADTTIRAKLIAARKKMTDPKMSGSNPHFKSKFVPLDEVLTAVVEPCLAAGLFVSQGLEAGELVTSVHDDTDTAILGRYPISPNSDPQKFMAAVTYAARKSLMLAFSFRGDEDDDGNTAAKKPEPAAPKPPTQAKQIAALVAANGHGEAVKKQMAEWLPKHTGPFTENNYNSLAPDAFDELVQIATLGMPEVAE